MTINKKSTTLFTIISVAQFVSMAFLIICCVTAPVFKQIGLSKAEDVTYGVFGYCTTNNGDSIRCSKASSSYNPQDLTDDNNLWTMNSNQRSILGKILIVTPIAAGLNFLSFVVTIITIILSILSTTGSISALMFTIELLFAILGFFSSALVCIISFLLFYPKMTWCSWLLIPAAALPLLIIPLIFVAHSSSSRTIDEIDDSTEAMLHDDPMDKSRFSIKEIYQNNDMTGSNILNQPTVLPDFQPFNDDMKKQITESSTDFSSLAKEKQDYNSPVEEYVKEQTNTISDLNTQGGSVRDDDDVDDDDGSNNEDEVQQRDRVALHDKRLSYPAFSVIDNEGKTNPENQSQTSRTAPYNIVPSIASSSYSNKNISDQRNSNKILEDLYNNNNDQGIEGSNNNHEIDDGLSDFTSVSQRGVNPNYYNNQLQLNSHSQRQPAGNLPYPQPSPQPQNYSQGPQYANQQPHYINRDNGMQQRNIIPQGRPQMNSQYNSNPLPTANNTNRGPIIRNAAQPAVGYPNYNSQPALQERRYNQPQQPYNNYRQGAIRNIQFNQPPSNIPMGSTHYKPSYKKRMANNLPSANSFNTGNPYGFR
ncbi:Tos7p NDAI_0G05330 [Naumovozyma dairenensis CBS 421]|uniref:PH-response regulator protein palI/RIM9 n=1 Tax=Naumovozyma dairenensis (strain ATCC 10597 / BCRC 20456 / CBS 421 / NBRC 0211 / NRRL Y-12639) TaxID=1071378 RepID=J7S4L2_NAUDC|nr:hypothetical protein NDAI_0G05330 [Naumovozyma dairenensis CBS 421]CCK73516.1 hypothetical protein NDAI_0G05330 [Naumovozyma dairenensis CBS 421]